MRGRATKVREARVVATVALLVTLVWPALPAGSQVVPPPPFAQANGCIDGAGTWGQRSVPITGTLSPTTVAPGAKAVLSATTVDQPIDLTRPIVGLRAAPTLTDVGTIDPADPTGPLVGQNDATTVAALTLAGAGTTEGTQALTGGGSQTFWVVSDGVTTTAFIGFPNPPSNSALVPVTQLDILVTLADTTWTASGGADVALSEHDAAPTDLVAPAAADVTSAPVRFLTTLNPSSATPVDLSVSCWPGTTAVDPVPTGALVPGLPTSFAGATVPPAPAAPTCTGVAITVAAGATSTVDAPARCTDPGGALVPSTVTITTPPGHGTASVDAATGLITYVNVDQAATSDAFSFTIANQGGRASAPATVAVTVVAGCDPATQTCPPDPVPVPVPVTPASLAAHQVGSFVPLGTVTLNGDYAVASGAMQPLTIADARGSGLGWSVTATVSDFVEAASSEVSCTAPTRTCIPGTNLGWVPAAQVISTSIPGTTSEVIPGPSLSDTLAPWVVPLNGTGTGSVLCFAPSGQGGGTYRCNARLFLAIPASAAGGSYVANLTLTVA